MIERKIVQQKFLNYSIAEFLKKESGDVAIHESIFEKTPLGERVTIYTSTPGLVIGREGSNIKKLTKSLKKKFNFENPQIKIGEVKNPSLSANIVAKVIANSLSRYGSQKFKLTGFKALGGVMYAGALGVEIRITGKLPSSRSKSWRFHKGYLKKTGYVSDFLIDKATESVTLKSGVVGIKVMIMLPDTPLPDKVEYIKIPTTTEETEKEEVTTDKKEVTTEKKEVKVEAKK